MTDYERRARRHPLFRSLVRRVARCEASMSPGLYGARWRRFERNVLYTVGHPYERAEGLNAQFQACNRVGRRMLAEVFPEPWPGDDRDMCAALYNVARHDVDRRASC